MRWLRIPRFWSASVAVGATVGLLGCYTVINHPRMNPQDQVTEQGNVVGQNQCTGCHTDAELWSFHHGAALYASGYDYYYGDSYLLRNSWYGDRFYYSRWLAYYHNPWWFYAPSGGAWVPEAPAIGRGEPRDSADSVEPRFSPFLDVVPGQTPLFSTGAGQPVSTGFVGGAAPRAKQDSTSASSDDGGRPVRVEPRYPPPASQPVATEAPSSSSTSTSTQEKQATNKDDQKDDDSGQARGRGDNREGGGSSGSR